MAVEEPGNSFEHQDTKNTTFWYDKHWPEWGTIFIPTAKNGAPIGLTDDSAPYYAHCICDKDGRVVAEYLRVKKADFRGVLEGLSKQRKVRKEIVGIGKDLEGYVMPLGEVEMETFLTMAGLNSLEQQNYNNTAITTITTDGSYRDHDKTCAGGRHAIIQRSGSYDYRDDFRKEFNAGGFNTDNTQAELTAIVEAVANLDASHEITKKFKASHRITIRTDFEDIANKINALKEAMAAESTPSAAPVPSVDKIISGIEKKEYRDLWKELVKFMRKHDIDAVEVRKTPDAKVCHNGANDARRNFEALVRRNRTQGITAVPKEILHLDTDKQLLKKTASLFLARQDSERFSPKENVRDSVVPVEYKYSRLRADDKRIADQIRRAAGADMVILNVGGVGLEAGYGLKLAKTLRDNGYTKPIIVYSGNSEAVIDYYIKKFSLDPANVTICSNVDNSVISMNKLYDTVQSLLKEQARSAAAERPSAIAPETIERMKSKEMELQ